MKDDSDESEEEIVDSNCHMSINGPDYSDDDIFALETPETTKLVNQQYKQAGGEILTITSSHIMHFGDSCYAVIFIDDLSPCWYYKCEQFTGAAMALYQSLKKSVPDVIKNLKEHKLRVKCSSTNEMIHRENSSYPETRWATVVPLNAVLPGQHLHQQLNRLSSLFKQALTPNEHMTPGRRFVTFCENSGNEKLIAGCKKYMGDISSIEKRTNEDLTKLGKKDHTYVFGAFLDEMWSDGSIKEFLQDFVGCSSWDDVPEDAKKICYKYYPKRRAELPDWDGITN